MARSVLGNLVAMAQGNRAVEEPHPENVRTVTESLVARSLVNFGSPEPSLAMSVVQREYEAWGDFATHVDGRRARLRVLRPRKPQIRRRGYLRLGLVYEIPKKERVSFGLISFAAVKHPPAPVTVLIRAGLAPKSCQQRHASESFEVDSRVRKAYPP